MKKVLDVIIFHDKIDSEKMETAISEFKKDKEINIHTIKGADPALSRKLVSELKARNLKIKEEGKNSDKKTKILAITGNVLWCCSAGGLCGPPLAKDLKTRLKNLVWAIFDERKEEGVLDYSFVDEFVVEKDKDIHEGSLEAITNIWQNEKYW